MSDSYDEGAFKSAIIRDDVAHQKAVGFRHFCIGCGWPSGYCCCPGSIERIIKELEDRLDLFRRQGSLPT